MASEHEWQCQVLVPVPVPSAKCQCQGPVHVVGVCGGGRGGGDYQKIVDHCPGKRKQIVLR